MQDSRNKIPSKNLVRQRWAEGFNSGVKGLKDGSMCVAGVLLLHTRVVLCSDLPFGQNYGKQVVNDKRIYDI
jgi:hypothetical protein